MKRTFVLMGLVAAAMIVTNAEAFRVTTNASGGADAELRESGPATTYGGGTEIASRVASNRNSLVYLKFGVADISAADLMGDITVRTTYRNNNLVESRFYHPDFGYTGWDYYVLDPTVNGANWDEATVSPNNPPPGYFYDGDYGTKAVYDEFGGLNPGLTYLGNQLYDSADLVGATAHLPIGGAFDFTLGTGSALHDAIIAAQATDHQTLTIVMTIMHDYVVDPEYPENNTPSNWVNFNYLFNPKEMATLNNDLDSIWGAGTIAEWGDVFAPQLTNEAHPFPEPATMVLLGLGGLLLRRKR